MRRTSLIFAPILGVLALFAIGARDDAEPQVRVVVAQRRSAMLNADIDAVMDTISAD